MYPEEASAKGSSRAPYRINSSGGIGRGWKRGKALSGLGGIEGSFLPRVASQSLPARRTRRCVEKNPASRLFGTCVANAYTRRARFPGVNGSGGLPSLPSLPSCSLVNPVDKCEKNTRRHYIEPMTISGAMFARAVYSRIINSLERNGGFKLY